MLSASLAVQPTSQTTIIALLYRLVTTRLDKCGTMLVGPVDANACLVQGFTIDTETGYKV